MKMSQPNPNKPNPDGLQTLERFLVQGFLWDAPFQAQDRFLEAA